jgi:hypothetical protein
MRESAVEVSMKSSVGVLLAAIIVFVLLAFEYWQYRDEQAYRNALNTQLVSLSQRVDSIDERIQSAKTELDTMKQNSLGGLIESANDALIHGWSAMIDSVEKELERAKKGIASQKQTTQPSQTSPSTDPAPNTGNGPL